MSSNNNKKYCCYCGREIKNNEEIMMIHSLNIIPKNSNYLCQDCCLEASIFIENVMNENTDTNAISKQIKLTSTLRSALDNNIKSQQIEKIYTSNAIVVEGDPSKPKILLNHTKKEVFDEVTKKVKYQDYAIKKIIRTIYYNLCIEDASFKENMLLIGNTGVGKTFAVTNILKTFNIPYVIVDSNDFTETGYIGRDVDTAVERLYKTSGNNAELASRGVIIFDEADKLRVGETTTRDVSGESVQEELLTLLTGKNVEVGRNTFVDTSFVTFILMGAFDDTNEKRRLSEIRKKRIEKTKNNSTIGFSTTPENADKPVITSYIAEDLNNYGIISQLSGRCTVIIEFNEFCEEMCRTILFDSTSSKLKHIYQKFDMLNVSLDINREAINATCKYIVELGFGARGISQYLNELFSPALEKIEDDLENDIAEYETCIITKNTIVDHNDFELIPKKLTAVQAQWY